jgi:hypothetical protein
VKRFQNPWFWCSASNETSSHGWERRSPRGSQLHARATCISKKREASCRARFLHERPAMNSEIETALRQIEDPRLIRGVYNYCHRWCERCPFTDRCAVFRENRRFEAEHPDATPFQHVRASFQQTIELLKAWCTREGIDFAQIEKEAKSDEAVADQRLSDESILADPLSKLAKAYSVGTWELMKAIDRVPHSNEWDGRVQDALETIRWYSAFIGAKVDRALHGARESPDDRSDQDAIQNDWNGSAKVARMAIEESRKAWLIVLEAGQTPPDSPLMRLVDLLAQMEGALAEVFPHSMLFVRPGFDEPEVAAGALSTLECFDPRPLSIVRHEKGTS